MNATRKSLTTLAIAAALAGGVAIAQTASPGTPGESTNNAAPSSGSTMGATTPSTDTTSPSASPSLPSGSSSTDMSASNAPAPQADRN